MRAVARAALIAAVLILRASMADAAEVRVLGVSAVAPAVEALAPEFRKDTGHGITLTLGSPAEVMAKIKAGEATVPHEGVASWLETSGEPNSEPWPGE